MLLHLKSYLLDLWWIGQTYLRAGLTFPSHTGAKEGHAVDWVVFDLSILNKFVMVYRFWMITVSGLSPSATGLWLASFDLKDAYWHVESSSAFQMEQWTLQFAILPFRSSQVPQLFTKLVRMVLQHPS